MLHNPHRAKTVPTGGSFRVGVVGIGVGTITAYGRAGDYIRYYEINPDVIGAATDPNGYFTFIRDSEAKVEIVPGDARLSIERELRDRKSQQFDVLTIDAFSGDAVPVHLITKEAIALYLQELRPDGVIAFHITNGPVKWVSRMCIMASCWRRSLTAISMFIVMKPMILTPASPK